MIIQVGKHKYSARGRATYLVNEAQKAIRLKYFWQYAPMDYFNEDGTVSLIDNDSGEKVPRELNEAERENMYARMYANPDYQAEMMDLHLLPIGRAPILSQYIEVHEPTEEEKEEIQKGILFFYDNGILNKLKKDASMQDTTSQVEAENLTIDSGT